MADIKVLHIHPVDSQLLNYIESNPKKVRYIHDIIHHKDIKVSERLIQSKAYNRLFRTTLITSNPIIWMFQVRRLIKRENYDIIHSHIGWFSSLLIIALFDIQSKIKIVVHVHSLKPPTTKSIGRLFFYFSKKLINKYSHKKIACSNKAGESLFVEDFEILENIVDYKKFKFNSDFRNEKRNQFNLKDEQLLIGHVGDFTKPKNHIFLLSVFKEITNARSDARLFLVGSGKSKEILDIRRISQQLGILEKVIFGGHRNDINELMSAFDIFIFPSLHEGFGMSFLESQISNLPCFVSERIPTEAFVNHKLTKVIDLATGPNNWSKIILKFLEENQNNELLNRTIDNRIDTKFSIESKQYRLFHIYQDLLDQ